MEAVERIAVPSGNDWFEAFAVSTFGFLEMVGEVFVPVFALAVANLFFAESKIGSNILDRI